ncbi:acyltransferase family protein [Cryobacterium sp. Sr3]|uniref:acyltransferase family protein n=1 Tax=Cryobacterium sp. Sr3 TaxID=1259194 RepID=UPI00106D4656|nr:acyltransferase family protein [Cryobacterium sp. Sr3]TFB61011.1 acyltransferase [Cryobacterium sp. Sr3]
MTAARNPTTLLERAPYASPSVRLGEKRVGFRADIQGLRAIAVLLVVLYHAKLPGLTGGYVGVDVFFVISGFLITAHLLATLADHGKISLIDFYARRLRRLLPASMTVIALTTVAARLWVPPLSLPPIFKDAAATSLYIPNFLFAQNDVDYLSGPNPSVFQHYWSLGVEEQFYLAWPLLMAIAFILFRRSSRAILCTLLVTLVVSLGLCVWITARAQPWAFFMVPTRAWEFAAGGVVAYLVSSTRIQLSTRLSGILSWSGIVGLFAAALAFDEATLFPGFAAALPVGAAVLIILGGALKNQARWTGQAVLSVRPLVFIGTISYSLYLVHWPLLVIPQIITSERHTLPLWASLALVTLSVPVAWLLDRLVENPASNWRLASIARPRATLWVAAALTVAFTSAALFALTNARTLPLYLLSKAPQAVVSTHPVGTNYVPSNMVPSIRKASADNPAIYGSGCHLPVVQTDPQGCTTGDFGAPVSVALFGDSHAAHWFPALDVLAEQGKIVLTAHTKSSCPSFELPAYLLVAPYPECAQWREGVVSRLESDPPAVVVLSNFLDGDLGGLGHRDLAALSTAVEQTVRRLSVESTVVVLADTPNFEISPSACLSAHLADADACSRRFSDARSLAIASVVETATKRGGGELVDLTRYLCNNHSCPVVIGDTLVYRDSSHLTASFSSLMSDVLGDKIMMSRRREISTPP